MLGHGLPDRELLEPVAVEVARHRDVGPTHSLAGRTGLGGDRGAMPLQDLAGPPGTDGHSPTVRVEEGIAITAGEALDLGAIQLD